MSGKVYLVGAGPGDEGLLTLRGKAVIEMAQVVVYDRLVSPAIMSMVPPAAEKIYVGKAAADHAMQQEDINQLLVDKAKAGFTVVRLKGGDPYVFGRGGEEGEKLFEEGVTFEVVPGITSAIGGLAYGGIPITHRELTSSFHVFTGHFKDDERDHDWENIAKLKGTKVFLMGVGNLEYIIGKTLAHGMSPTMPVAIISNASRGNQKVLTSTALTVVEDAKAAQIKPPSLLVIGEVVNMRKALNWFENRPLFGSKIVVTRAKAQSGSLAGRLRDLGASVTELPAIKIVPRAVESFKNEFESLKDYTWLVFTSENGVEIFMEGLLQEGKDARALGNCKIAVIGSGTEKKLRSYGIQADLKPERFVAEGLIESLEGVLTPEDSVLVPRASEARDLLVKWLETKCRVKEVPLYDTVVETDLDIELLNAIDEADWVTFTSASTVKHFMAQMESANKTLPTAIKFASIGPITTKALEEKGLEASIEAKVHDLSGLIEALTEVNRHGEI